jgi:hypothetical protein
MQGSGRRMCVSTAWHLQKMYFVTGHHTVTLCKIAPAAGRAVAEAACHRCGS